VSIVALLLRRPVCRPSFPAPARPTPRSTTALERELATALQAVGVVAPAGIGPSATVGRPNPPWGQSAKLALERTLRAGVEEGDRQLEGRHLLLALARAEAGVVPRLLDELDITPAKIRSASG
jgi:hypothetical protein